MAQALLIATFRHRLPRSYKVVTDEESAKRPYIRSDTAADELGGIPNSTPHPPQCLPPYPRHSETIPHIYRYTRPCSDSERNVKNIECIDIMVYQWKSKHFFSEDGDVKKINLDVRFSSSAGFIQKKNYIWNLIFLLILRRKNHYVGLTGSLYD